jgi:hypothetical protein
MSPVPKFDERAGVKITPTEEACRAGVRDKHAKGGLDMAHVCSIG